MTQLDKTLNADLAPETSDARSDDIWGDDDLNEVTEEEISQEELVTLPPETTKFTHAESTIARELRLALDELEDKILNEVAGVREMVFNMITTSDNPTWKSDIKEHLKDTQEQMKTMDEELRVGLNRLTEEIDRVNHSVKSLHEKVEQGRNSQIDSHLTDFLCEVEPDSDTLPSDSIKESRNKSTIPPPKLSRS